MVYAPGKKWDKTTEGGAVLDDILCSDDVLHILAKLYGNVNDVGVATIDKKWAKMNPETLNLFFTPGREMKTWVKKAVNIA